MNTTLQEILKEHGVMPTPQRLAVFASLAARRDHPSVDRVFSDLRRKIPTLSKTTVYATLQLLAEKRLIGRVRVDAEEIRYDGDLKFHAHFRCRACGAIFDIGLDAPHERPFANLPDGFEAENEELVYYGLCPKCKKKKGKTR